MKTTSKFLLFLIILIILLVYFQISSVKNSTTSRGEPPVLGWIESNCLAVNRNDIRSDTYIFVVTLDGQQDITEARVVGQATNQKCAPLADERGEINKSNNLSYYTIEPNTPFKYGIAVFGKIGKQKVKNNLVYADIDSDRRVEQFTICTANKGIIFNVWKTEPYKSKPLWTGQNYLAQNVEKTCP